MDATDVMFFFRIHIRIVFCYFCVVSNNPSTFIKKEVMEINKIDQEKRRGWDDVFGRTALAGLFEPFFFIFGIFYKCHSTQEISVL